MGEKIPAIEARSINPRKVSPIPVVEMAVVEAISPELWRNQIKQAMSQHPWPKKQQHWRVYSKQVSYHRKCCPGRPLPQWRRKCRRRWRKEVVVTARNEVRRKQRWRRQSGSKVRRREDWERKLSWPLDWESGFDLRNKTK